MNLFRRKSESAAVNNVIVFVKAAVVLLFIVTRSGRSTRPTGLR